MNLGKTNYRVGGTRGGADRTYRSLLWLYTRFIM